MNNKFKHLSFSECASIEVALNKGLSFKQIALMMNHINSYPRKKVGDKTPYETFKTFYGQDILKKLDVTPISLDNVILQPTLLK